MHKKRKIVVFDGSFKTTTFINRLLKGLSKNHQVYVFGFNDTLLHPIPRIIYVPLGTNQSKFRFLKITMYWAFKSGSLGSFFHYLLLLVKNDRKQIQQKNLQQALSKVQPDIIHLQWPSLLPWFETVLEKKQYPVILSQRGFHINVRPHIDTENRNYLQQWLPKVAGFHSVSKAISKVGDTLYANPQKIDKVVYSGFDLSVLNYQSYKPHNGTLKIISIGRSHWKKNYQDAIIACHTLSQLKIDFQYQIIGATKSEELLYLIAHFNLAEKITLCPPISQDEVYEKMQHSDLFLSTSVEEGLPNVMLEAMALGLPIIATDCGGVPEVISSETGVLIPTRDPQAIVDAIQEFINTPIEIVNQRCLKARNTIEKQHSSQKMSADMEALYEEVIEKFSNSHLASN